MRDKFISLLQSPDDNTPINSDLTSEGGIQYSQTDSNIYMLDANSGKYSDKIYSHEEFEKWSSIVENRIQYYTTKKSIAGRIAHWSYRSLDLVNERKADEFVLDIGAGDGAHISRCKVQESYVALDRNLDRLNILKQNYPKVNAIYGDASRLPLKNGSMKYIFSSNAFEHFWYLKDTIFECFRVLDKNGVLLVVIPTEGGLWNLGRRLISKRHFNKNHPDIDFDLISHMEHCNNANQIIRNLELFFDVKRKYMPTGIPTVYANILVELQCTPKYSLSKFKD